MKHSLERLCSQVPPIERGVLDALSELGVATACEAHGACRLLQPTLRPVWSGARIAGTALTVALPAGDNRSLREAIPALQDGDVLVVAPMSVSEDGYFGELLAISAASYGCRGLIIDAGVRDVRDLTRMQFPVWSRCVSAQGTAKLRRGAVNEPLICAGAFICPGDVIVADDDGVCVIQREDVTAALENARVRAAEEAEIRAQIALDVRERHCG